IAYAKIGKTSNDGVLFYFSLLIGDDSVKARTISLDAAVLSLDGTRCVEGKMSTDLPFFMPWDCPKRARRDESENSSQRLFLNDEITEAEGEYAEDENAIILGVQVSPICCIGRLRMVRARSLGEALADHLHAAGAGEILAEIRATGTSKSDPVEPKQTQESASTTNEMTGKPKHKRKAFYRRCAAGEQRAKQRRLEAAGEAEGKMPIRRLEPGMTGFLFTSNNKDIHQAKIEVYRLLNEANTRINGPKKEEETEEKVSEEQKSNEDDDYVDFASALKEELKSDSKSGRYIFNGVKTGVSNCGFVLNQSEHNSSADLINDIFQHTMENGEADTRRVLRILPIVGTCRPDVDDLSALLRRSFKAYWDSSVEGSEDLGPLCLICPKVPLQRARFIEKPNSADAKLYFTVNFKARNYDKMKKEEAVMAVITTLQEIAPEWSPITLGADLIISVDVVCNVLCLSFLEKYNEFAKYNIQQAAEMSGVSSKA
ncbi:unnamed protein product, partial [Rodentolepis nana]|uniref:THUMP domain-containing protein n=1 Tax=Rodentolepis nana TaxID=102285 RepID=A0A0R3TEB7_RODNA